MVHLGGSHVLRLVFRILPPLDMTGRNLYFRYQPANLTPYQLLCNSSIYSVVHRHRHCPATHLLPSHTTSVLYPLCLLPRPLLQVATLHKSVRSSLTTHHADDVKIPQRVPASQTLATSSHTTQIREEFSYFPPRR